MMTDKKFIVIIVSCRKVRVIYENNNNADHVGAINVLERGYRLLACGGAALSRSVKQEPTEVSQLFFS